MKILFPTDFSNAAENAYVYALKLADRLHAGITVVHVYELLQLHTWIEESMNTKEVNEKITLGEFERFKDEIELLKRIARENNLEHVDVNYSLQESDYVVDAILQVAADEKADMIVMGTTGARGLKEIFFGSVAAKVMELSPCPVFSVPDTATFRGIERIGLTLELRSAELELIEKSLGIARRLGAHLYCLHVDVHDSQKLKSKIADYQQAFAQEPEISFHTYAELDVEKGILEFMEKQQMDVIVMKVRPQSLLRDLFSFSIAKRIAYHSDIPLIALHLRES